MDFRTWQASEWAAFGGVGALIVYIVLGVIAIRQLRESRRLRELEYRPYVIVDFYFKGFFVFLEVRNTGRNPARDVTVSFDKELVPSDDRRSANFSIFDQPIPMMAPGRSIRLPLGSGPAFFDENQIAPLSYEVHVTYEDMAGKVHRDPPLLLDLSPYKHTVPPRDDAADLVSAVRQIRDLQKNWTSSSGLKVLSTDQLRAERRRDRVDHVYDAPCVRTRRGSRRYPWRGAAFPPPFWIAVRCCPGVPRLLIREKHASIHRYRPDWGSSVLPTHAMRYKDHQNVDP